MKDWIYGTWSSCAEVLQSLLTFGTRSKRLVSFTLRSLQPRGNGPRCLLDSRLGGPQNCPRRSAGKKRSVTLPVRERGRPDLEQFVARPSDIPHVPCRINKSTSLDLPIFQMFLTVSIKARR